MRFLKSNKLASIINSYVVDSPQPSNISYMWNFGSLLATCLGLQIVTGIILAIVCAWRLNIGITGNLYLNNL